METTAGIGPKNYTGKQCNERARALFVRVLDECDKVIAAMGGALLTEQQQDTLRALSEVGEMCANGNDFEAADED